MLFNLFIEGLIIGFSIAMPVGPIGILCIQHALLRGMIAGLIAGLGAAFADAIYGALAGFGVTMISQFLESNQYWFQVGGALFLLYLGAKIFTSVPSEESAQETNKLSYFRLFFGTFGLTLTNPLTILSFVGVYAALGVGEEEGLASPLLLTGGVLLGSALWWVLLSVSVTLLGKKLHFKPTQILNRISGFLILACGMLAGYSALINYKPF